MIRARLIEKVVADWLEGDGWIVSGDGMGTAEYEIERGPSSAVISVVSLADAIDLELDRISREAAK